MYPFHTGKSLDERCVFGSYKHGLAFYHARAEDSGWAGAHMVVMLKELHLTIQAQVPAELTSRDVISIIDHCKTMLGVSKSTQTVLVVNGHKILVPIEDSEILGGA